MLWAQVSSAHQSSILQPCGLPAQNPAALTVIPSISELVPSELGCTADCAASTNGQSRSFRYVHGVSSSHFGSHFAIDGKMRSIDRPAPSAARTFTVISARAGTCLD